MRWARPPVARSPGFRSESSTKSVDRGRCVSPWSLISLTSCESHQQVLAHATRYSWSYIDTSGGFEPLTFSTRDRYIDLVLRVSVTLPASFDDVGEYLADATALEAAGADTIWLDDTTLDPWVMLGAIAAVTHRVTLGCVLTSVGAATAQTVGPPVAALHKVSRGRVVVALPDQGKLTERVAMLRAAGARIFTTIAQWKEADGAILRVDSADQLPSKSDSQFEMWAAIAAPPDRESWAKVLSSYDAAGASGVILPWSTRLVDLLRNPEPDDRTDLLISTG